MGFASCKPADALVTGCIARSAKRRYLSYSEADFEFFLPRMQGRQDEGEIWHGGDPCQISPHRCNDKGIRTPKTEMLLRFDQNVECKHTAGAYPLHNFHKICTICTTFHDALAVEISLDLLKGLWSYGGLS